MRPWTIPLLVLGLPGFGQPPVTPAPQPPTPAPAVPQPAPVAPTVAAAPEPPELSRDQRWQEDVDFLGAELPKRHKDAFFKCTKEEFESAAAKLRAAVPSLKDHQVIVGMMKLAAMLGDSHTGINPGVVKPAFRYFPLSLYMFSDGPVIVAARESQQDLVGCTLIKFGDTPAEEALRRVGSAFAYENESFFKASAGRHLITAEIAEAVGLIPGGGLDRVSITVRSREGVERTVELTPIEPGERLNAPDRDSPSLPRYRQRRTPTNWFEVLPEHDALYFHYDRCADEPGQKVVELTNQILEVADGTHVSRVIVDLRTNGGGNSALLLGLIQGLKSRPALSRPGGVMVLIGRGTFSSAQMNAAALKREANATLIGEPTGQKPNAFGEVRGFDLPHSKIQVRYSTKRFETEPGDRPSMDPDVAVGITAAEYFSLKDPVLEASLKYKP